MTTRRLLDLVAPPRCAGCGVRGSLPWCPACRDAARALQHDGGCPRCAGRCTDTGARCPLADSPVTATRAAFVYTGVVAATVVAAKIGGHHACWHPLGEHLGTVLARRPVDADVVVPVATEPGRARHRGFDHAVLLGRAVASVLELPCRPALRTRRRTPDRGAGDAPTDLPDGAVRAVRDLTGHRVLLVDDVLTTGATVRAAAHAVAAAGTDRVEVAVLARAGG